MYLSLNRNSCVHRDDLRGVIFSQDDNQYAQCDHGSSIVKYLVGGVDIGQCNPCGQNECISLDA